jgi:4'-phosphopantetheinyl transferase
MITALDGLPGCTVSLADLDDLDSLQTDLCALSSGELERLRRIVDPVQRARRARCRAALRSILGEALGVPAKRVPLATDPGGKPYVIGARGLSFSVSHSGAVGAIAVATEGPVGVDIEVARSPRNVVRLARRWFSSAEIGALERLPPDLRARSFLRCWTAKEAVAKAVGEPLSELIHQVIVDPDPRRPPRILGGPHAAGTWTLSEPSIPALFGGDTVVTVAVGNASLGERGRAADTSRVSQAPASRSRKARGENTGISASSARR